MSISNGLYLMAQKMLAREGQSATLYQVDTDASDYDPSTGLNTPSAPLQTPVKIILLDFAILANGLQPKPNTLIEANDKQCYMSAEVFPKHPSPVGDYLVDSSGNRWAIKLVKEYNLNGSQAIMFDLLVRK